MKISTAGIKLIEGFEALRLVAYQDVKGIWTIGYGHTGRDVCPGLTITEEEANNLLLLDLGVAEAAVNRLVTRTITQNQFDALVSFTFNVGVGALASSTLLKDVNARDLTDAAAQFLRWDHAGDVEVEGLRNRRVAEAALFDSK